MIENKEQSIICLASCHLPLSDHNVEIWNKVNDVLEKYNINLILMVSDSNTEKLNMPTIKIPLFLDEIDEVANLELYDDYYISDQDILLIERDFFWSNAKVDFYNYYRKIKGLVYFVNFYSKLLDILQPDIVFSWGNLLPQSKLLYRVAREKGISTFYLERGFLPGSLMVEDYVYNYFLELKNSFINHISEENLLKDFYYLKDYFYNKKYAKYPYNNNFILERLFEDKKKKIITFFPSVDVCFFPYEQAEVKNFSSSLTTNLNIAIKLVQIVNEFDDLLLIIKLHPAENLSRYSYLQSDKVVVTKDGNVHSIISSSDLLVFTTSTLQYEAVFFEKPIVLFSMTPLSGNDFVYEIKHEDSIKEIILDAINYNEEKCVINKAKFIYNLLQTPTYFYLDDIEKVKDLNDFAMFIKEKVQYNQKRDSLLYRIIKAENFISSVRSVHKSIMNPKSIFKNSFVENCINKLKFRVKEYHSNLKNYIYDKIRKGEILDVELELNSILSNEYLNDEDILIQIENKRKELKKLNSWDPKSSSKNLLEAEKKIENNHLQEAKILLSKIVNIEPMHLEALNDLAVLYILEGNYPMAERVLKYIMSNDNSNEVVSDNYKYLMKVCQKSV